MRPGSEQHKELFCRSFIQTHARWEPESLPWPDLGANDLELLRALPVWDTLWQVERNAGIMVTQFAERQPDALVREALRLQGYEEDRHGRLIGEMVARYEIPATSQEPEVRITEQAFIDFGCGECIDSFIGFGAFKLARDAAFLPDALFEIFSRVLSEEARHITFFVNWLAYERARKPAWNRFGYSLKAAGGYWHGVRNVARNGKAAAGGAPPVGEDVFAGLTLERVLEACLSENARLMSEFDPALIRPRLMPRIARVGLALARIPSRLPSRRNLRNVEQAKDQDGGPRAESNASEHLEQRVRS